MREILANFQNMAHDGPMDALIYVIVLLCAVIVLGYAVYGIWVAFDSWFLELEHDIGRILTKAEVGSEGSLHIAIGRKEGFLNVEPELFSSLAAGQEVVVYYSLGRFSGKIYISGISLQ